MEEKFGIKNNKKALVIGISIFVLLIIIIISIVIAINNGLFKRNLSGKYMLIEMQENGEITNKEDLDVLKKFNLEVTLELNEDKTGVYNYFGKNINILYDDNKFVIEKKECPYKVEKNKIIIEKDNSREVFEKIVEK